VQKIGLIGLGAMGSGMAGQLLKAGYSLAVYNRTQGRATELAGKGARVASSPADAAKDADIIIAMVADDDASRKVWLGDDGVLSAAKPGAIAIECSTLTPAWVGELAQAAAKRQVGFLDAPVTGSKVHAASGELLFLVGGDAAILERARPVLKVMSRDILHLGGTGSGALMKLINNFICGVQAASFGEALALIEHSPLNRDQALQVLNGGAPGSPLVKLMSQRMTSRAYDDVNFALKLMLKDLRYATKEAEGHGIQFNTGLAAAKVFEQAKERGWGDKDFSSLVEALR